MKLAYLLLTLVSLSAVCQTKPTGGSAALSEANCQLAWDYCQQSGTRAMLVMQDGKLLFEQYANGGSATRPQLLASGSKSFNGVLAEAAVEDGLLKLDDKVSDVVTEWKNDPQKSKITYRQLLTLTSGLSPGSIRGKLGLSGWNDVLSVPMVSAPGEKFEYGGNHLNAFAAALQRKLKNETYESYLKRRILDPLGITLAWRGRFDDGNPQVAGGGFMTARDWATFGEWVRQEGKWNGKQIIAKNRLAECFASSPQNPAYGLTWWLKKPVDRELLQEIPLLRTELGPLLISTYIPDDLVMAAGAGKQRLYIIPSLKLVALRQGPLLSANGQFADIEFLSRLLRGKPNSQ